MGQLIVKYLADVLPEILKNRVLAMETFKYAICNKH